MTPVTFPSRSCPVCSCQLADPVYRSYLGVMITSLCGLLPGAQEVYVCERCGHISSPALPDLEKYYATDYQILVASEDEDQLYSTSGGKMTYRFDHQLDTLLDKIKLPEGARVLDFGAAKGTTLKRLRENRPDIDAHLFDVSDIYLPFWARFSSPDNWAVFQVPATWMGRFDLIMSFYALEHVADPAAFLQTVRGLLSDRGVAYLIVPNVFANTGDFLVADHVNHFTRPSLEFALRAAGFDRIQVDDASHAGAFVITARAACHSSTIDSERDVDAAVVRARELADYWSAFPQRVREFECAHWEVDPVAVYGSGFYGTLTVACLSKPDRVSCFLDRNPHRWAMKLLDRPILPPDRLPADVRGVYVGLNPARAKQDVAVLTADPQFPVTIFYP